jgi:hypothetical protein
MARRSPQTQAKRQREFDKAEKRREKSERRALRKAIKSGEVSESPDAADEVDAGADTVAETPDAE